MTTKPSNPPYSSSLFTGLDEHADAVKFAHALHPPPAGLFTAQHFTPSVTPLSSCLDVLLFRGVLLVAYAAADELVIAKATDLQPIKRLRPPRNTDATVTALAFRQRDAAVAAAFGSTVVVFEGWSTGAKERASVYESSCIETTLNLNSSSSNVVSLSWDENGMHLCAVADCIVVWVLDPEYLPVRYTASYHVPREEVPNLPLSLAALSPDASLVVCCELYARVAYIWDLKKSPNSRRCIAEIAHGRSGIAGLDWKKRGGGNQALMTTDRDGTIRLWVRSFLFRYNQHHHRRPIEHHINQTNAYNANPSVSASVISSVNEYPENDEVGDPIAAGADSWMEEIARSPHVERTPRAGAAFLSWGGGGGVADDEGDAKATNAVIPMLAGTAPKPSRCHHWIVCVAGGDARAWRVRGLDDRPRAEFTRLEPGSGEPLLGVEVDLEDELPKELPLKDISVVALRAVAPIPLTTASQYKVGLVKSYAISNGERRLRSPEPPDPPNIVAMFVLAVRNGFPFLARYDFCPTSAVPAVCRARIGLGHTSNVVSIIGSEINSSSVLECGGWLASMGQDGDVLVWRTNVSTGAWGPMRTVAIIPGPHTAVAFGPTKCASPNRWEVAVFSFDAATESLRLFTFVNFVSRHDHAAGEDVQTAKQIAVCHEKVSNSSSTVKIENAVKQLAVVCLHCKGDLDAANTATVVVFGVRQKGALTTWVMTRRQGDSVEVENLAMRVVGRKPDYVKCIAATELASISKQILVCGGSDGVLMMYIVGFSEQDVSSGLHNDDEDYSVDDIGASEDENEDLNLGVVWLKEMCRLENVEYEGDAIIHVEMMAGASRIMSVHASGATIVWARDTTEQTKWDVELVVPGQVDGDADTESGCQSQSQPQSKSLTSSMTSNKVDERKESITTTSSIGYDREGNLSVVVLCSDGLFDRYRRVLGQPWQCVHRKEAPQDSLKGGAHSIVHIGKGVIVTTNSHGLSVLSSTRSDTQTTSYTSDAAGYSPSKALVAQLLTGGRAWQVSAALDELHSFVRKVTKKTISETSGSAGIGLIAPPPSLKVLLSERDTAENEGEFSENTPDFDGVATNTFQFGTGSNLFMELMAKSSAKFSRGDNNDSFDTDSSENGKSDLSMLANRLRVVSLAGLTRSEQDVLAAIAKACSSLKKTLGSLDVSGARYALLASSHRELTKTEPVPLSIVANAVHSSSRDALMDHFLPATSPGSKAGGDSSLSKMWETAKSLGAGWWVNTTSECRKLAERIARADFSANRNADDAALWYVALGRKTTLAALYRAQRNTRMAQFLLRNFDQSENRLAAGKNAYVLVSKHRLELAVTFFILSGDVSGALTLVRSRVKDLQLSLFLARVIGDEVHVKSTLEFIIEKSRQENDEHQRSIALWLNGQHEAALLLAGSPKNKINFERVGENVRALVGCLPDVVLCLGHVLAIADRPPVRGTVLAKKTVAECRKKAVQALLGDGSPVAALVIAFEIIRAEGNNTQEKARERTSSKRNVKTTLNLALLAAADVIQGRVACMSGAVRSGAVEESLQDLVLQDIKDLEASPLGLGRTIAAVERATFELVKEDEIDCATAASYAALDVLGDFNSAQSDRALIRRIQVAQRNCLRIAVSKALLYVQGTLSPLHYPCFSSHQLADLLAKYKLAITLIDQAAVQPGSLYHRLTLEFKGSVLSLRFAYMFLKGDWPGILQALRSCDLSWEPRERIEDTIADHDKDDSLSSTSCTSMAPDAVSIEALRHVASNPAVLRISRNLGHVRRYRKTPSMSIVGDALGSSVVVVDENFGAPTLAVSSEDPYAVIRMHPALSSTLASAAAAYLAAHLAANAAAFARFASKDARQRHRNSELYWQCTDSTQGYDQSFRLIKASEALEHLMEDAIAQWVPLQRFGIEASEESMSHPDESAGAFVDLWSTLGCLPEYAPSLSEAATVAAAEMAAAASRAAIEAAEQKDGGRRRRRRKERQGQFVSNAAKEGLKLFDTTSADSLYGAYPVRFSSSAPGPWSGRGKHATLYSEERSLFRTLCVSSTDPPAVVVATPKGIQEIVPSSYTTMPSGFRSHYASNQRKNGVEGTDERLAALAVDQDRDGYDDAGGYDDDGAFVNSYDGFGEGPYVPLDLSRDNKKSSNHPSRLSDGVGRKAVWRHQVNAMTLASHPLRRRFASGGSDGVVRLWDFADPISLASFREGNFGRISDIRFSGYGNTMLAVYASGHVVIWDDPDVYSSYPRKLGSSGNSDKGSGSGSRAKTIRAFDSRSASAATFLDERHTIAVVGDPTAPPSVGHSLRIFDTREANSAFHASWSAAVNHQFEARCVSLLEDRMRVVTGGLDGSLSIVDLRTKACIAELHGHSDEVTCLALESPRGRALVSGSASGEIRLWDSRTLLCLDTLPDAHTPTRHYWSGNGFSGLVGSYGTQGLALSDRSLISCGGDGMVKIWGPGWSDFDLKVL